MLDQANNSQLSDLITEIENIEGVCFDPKELSLHGLYEDELSAYRAKKGWCEVFESCFFLENKADFEVRVLGDQLRGKFVITCEFKSASGRYAFWRLTHQQAPEAQYLIEAAHLPHASSGEKLGEAADMIPLVEDPFRLGDGLFMTSSTERNVLSKIIESVKALIKSTKLDSKEKN